VPSCLDQWEVGQKKIDGFLQICVNVGEVERKKVLAYIFVALLGKK